MLPNEKKLTVHVDNDEYLAFTHKMHHGQISQAIRKFIRAVNEMTTPAEQKEFTVWAYGSGPLTLKQPKEE